MSTGIGGRCRDVLKGRFYHPLLPEKVQEDLFIGTLIQHPALSGAMDGVPWARSVRSDDGCANNWQHHLSQSAEVHQQGMAPSITIGRMPNQEAFDEDKTHSAISSGANLMKDFLWEKRWNHENPCGEGKARNEVSNYQLRIKSVGQSMELAEAVQQHQMTQQSLIP